MTQEDKQLLLVDLCARLPYNVICSTAFGNSVVLYIDIYEGTIYIPNNEWVYDFKPYLRPMSSMTEEEVDEFTQFDIYDDGKYVIPNYKAIDWLNAHHFDYRGLIEKGLAIEVTKENNPYENNN